MNDTLRERAIEAVRKVFRDNGHYLPLDFGGEIVAAVLSVLHEAGEQGDGAWAAEVALDNVLDRIGQDISRESAIHAVDELRRDGWVLVRSSPAAAGEQGDGNPWFGSEVAEPDPTGHLVDTLAEVFDELEATGEVQTHYRARAKDCDCRTCRVIAQAVAILDPPSPAVAGEQDGIGETTEGEGDV